MNTTKRSKVEFLDYDLGTCNGWDGDLEYIQFLDWRPGPDVKYVVPNSRGNELMLTIEIPKGKVSIQDFDAENDDEVTGGWKQIAEVSWREFIGHKPAVAS